MAFDSKIQLKGGPELEKLLKDLDRKVSRKIASTAMRAGARIVLAEAKANAPVDTGFLKKQLRVRAGKKRNKKYVRFIVGTGDAYYGNFIEFGYRLGKRPSRQKRRKLSTITKFVNTVKKIIGLAGSQDEDTRPEIPARPFMQPAFEKTKEIATAKIIETVRTGIYDAIGKGLHFLKTDCGQAASCSRRS